MTCSSDIFSEQFNSQDAEDVLLLLLLLRDKCQVCNWLHSPWPFYSYL